MPKRWWLFTQKIQEGYAYGLVVFYPINDWEVWSVRIFVFIAFSILSVSQHLYTKYISLGVRQLMLLISQCHSNIALSKVNIFLNSIILLLDLCVML
jgi:hypothetical protein